MPKRNDILLYDRHLRQRARELRNHSTLAEVRLWREIKGKALGLEFHRQVPIESHCPLRLAYSLRTRGEVNAAARIGEPQPTTEIG